MIIFDRLQISDNGIYLYIDAHVSQADYFENVYIDKVVIQTADQVSEIDPLTPGSANIYEMTVSGDVKELHLALNANIDFAEVMHTLSNQLLFVYVICKGTPSPSTPCGMDEMTTLGVTFDEVVLYQKIMQYTKELANTCEIPRAFIDLILLWEGFKASVNTGHYIVAIDFWRKMFDNISVTTNRPCGCHG